jgi:hypothetical protein
MNRCRQTDRSIQDGRPLGLEAARIRTAATDQKNIVSGARGIARPTSRIGTT